MYQRSSSSVYLRAILSCYPSIADEPREHFPLAASSLFPSYSTASRHSSGFRNPLPGRAHGPSWGIWPYTVLKSRTICEQLPVLSRSPRKEIMMSRSRQEPDLFNSTRTRHVTLRSGHTAYRHASLVDLYLHTKFHWNRRNILWTDGRMEGRTGIWDPLRSTRRCQPKNPKIAISQAQFERFRRNLAQWCSSTLLTVPTIKM